MPEPNGKAPDPKQRKEKFWAYVTMAAFFGVPMLMALGMLWLVNSSSIVYPACFPSVPPGSTAAQPGGEIEAPVACQVDAGELQKRLVQHDQHITRLVFTGTNMVKVELDGGKRISNVQLPEGTAAGLSALAGQQGVSYGAQAPSSMGGFFTNNWFLLVLLIPMLMMALRQGMPGANQARAMGFGKSRHKSIEYPTVTFEDVAGIDEAQQDLQEVVDFLANPEEAGRLGGRVPKGVLLIGPPGTGKTLAARAIAGEASKAAAKSGRRVGFFTISGSDFVEMFVGVGASRVRDLFTQGKENAPCIIFIDEIDAVGRQRGAGVGGGNDEREQTLNAMLVELDGFESNSGVILVAATNRPDVLDPALLRPGRFDRQVMVPPPDINGREKILTVHMKKLTAVAADVKPRIIARGTPGFTGADLANLVNEAALLGTKLGLPAVTLLCFEKSKDKVMAGTERPGTLAAMTAEDRRLTSYHEIGHTLGILREPGNMPLHKVTIMPRGRALGLTMGLPERDKYNKTKREMRGGLLTLYAGREAEVLLVGEDDVTTGASGDYQQATKDCRDFVMKYGFSGLPPLVYSQDEGEVFLGRSVTQHRQMSELTARKVDDAIATLAFERQKAAHSLLERSKAELVAMSELLFFAETLTADQVKSVERGVLAALETAGDQPVLNGSMSIEQFAALGQAARPFAEKLGNLMDGESKEELILDACERFGKEAAEAILEALPAPASA